LWGNIIGYFDFIFRVPWYIREYALYDANEHVYAPAVDLLITQAQNVATAYVAHYAVSQL